jgi:DNA-binding transcriptional MerR regulator
MYTVKQLSDLAGVSVRTLHYYDEIGLLKPSSVRENGYRSYSDDAMFRLQQVLFYRELDLDLMQIKMIINNPEFNLVTALQSHRAQLQEKIDRLQTLISTVDTTILHLIGEVNMSNKKVFEGFSEEKQKQYEEEAQNLWGDKVKQSTQLWNSYSEQKKQQIMQEGNDIYADIAANMSKGPQSPEVQAILVRWHQHLRYFYEPSLQILRGLGEMYQDNPDFNTNFAGLHPDLPAFLKQAITYYVDGLEKK